MGGELNVHWLVEWWHDLEAALVGMMRWVEGLAQSPHAGWALFGVAFAESSIFPIPPDVLLIALCIARPEEAFVYALICSVGSVLGGMAGYGLGLWGGRPLLKRLFSTRRIAGVERLYDRYNAWATGIAGFTPIPYKVFTISGGVFAIDFRIFLLASAVSRSLRFFLIGALVYFYGAAIRIFLERWLGPLTILFVVILIGGFWLFGHGLRRGARESR